MTNNVVHTCADKVITVGPQLQITTHEFTRLNQLYVKCNWHRNRRAAWKSLYACFRAARRCLGPSWASALATQSIPANEELIRIRMMLRDV